MQDCIFCKIARGEIPCAKVYEDERALAFNDIDPQAPVHVIVIPKAHVASVLDPANDGDTFCALNAAARAVALQLGLDKSGFRLVINTGRDGGQSVNHLHMHILGGRRLAWPPG